MAEQKLVEIRRDDKNCAVVNLHGATLQSWINDGTEMVFVSKQAVFDNKKAIRGGIPVVFPCFGAWDRGPQHGFARNSPWSVAQEPSKDSDGNAVAVFQLVDNEYTRGLWDNNKFKLLYTVKVSGDGLTTALSVTNLNDKEAFSFTWLLHTYFRLPDISKTTISGLGGLTYVDKVDGFKEKQEANDPMTITGFTDRVYKGASRDHVITNVAGGKTLCVQKSEFPETVVWNPWIEKAKSIGDLGDDEYRFLVCVEAGYVVEPYKLPAGQSFTSSQNIKIVS